MDKLKKQFVELFDLPPEVILNLPLLMVIGNSRLQIENHKGLRKYNSDEIKIKIKEGYIIVHGKNLIVKEISEDSLSITGCIYDLSYLYKEGPSGND